MSPMTTFAPSWPGSAGGMVMGTAAAVSGITISGRVRRSDTGRSREGRQGGAMGGRDRDRYGGKGPYP